MKTEGGRELLQRCVAPVLQDDEGDGQLQLRRAPQRLDGVHRGAVANQPDDLAIGLGHRHPHGGGQPVAQAAAAHGVEGFALQDGQVGMHGGARAGGFLHHDGGGIAHLGQGLHHIGHAHQDAGLRGLDARPRGAGRGQGAHCRRGARQQVLHAQAHAAHGRGAFGCPGGRARVVDQLHQLRPGRHMGAKTFHVVGEGGGAQRKHQVVPAEQRHDLLAHGRQHARKQAVVLRKAAAA